ncbi:MAG TPA: trypsin-like peptidase domain-containing protein [Nocardioidaceae bacterium]|nr:trypsin-like peptidase domain-containing protein [Nocardioidaceae bacterium]
MSEYDEHPAGTPAEGPPGQSPSTEPQLPAATTAPIGPAGQPPTAMPTGAVPNAARRRRRWPMMVGAGAGLVALAVGSGVAGAEIATHNGTTSTVVIGATTGSTAAAQSATRAPTEPLAKVAAEVLPSVVSITVRTSSQADEGSGVILQPDGVIVTNNHVVEAAASGSGTIRVTFNDGKTAAASIVGRDVPDDLAVIKAHGVSGLTPATLGSAKSLQVGDSVLAIGSPLGLEGTVTSGIVSALHRSVNLGNEQQGQGGSPFPGNPFGFPGQQQAPKAVTDSVLTEAIQTDAAINPGNSGGPLVNASGQVVGINTAIATVNSSSTSGGQVGSIGVGFAIPIDEAETVVAQLLKGEQPKHAWLGVEITNARAAGAMVAAVTNGSPAAKAGLRAGDVITKIDGTAITGPDDLVTVIRSDQPGDKITVTYRRDGSAHTVRLSLGSANG